jgi:hypothetical protein
MFDVNAKIGHWPYRPVGGLDDVLRNMDQFGIERAAVSSLNSVHYFNPDDGNDELLRAVRNHGDRFVPLAVVRPNYTGWADDLRRCLDDCGMRGLVMYPNYHRFSLSDAENHDIHRLVEICTSRQVPVCVQISVEDARRQFRRMIVEDTSAEAVGVFASRHPELKVAALGIKYSQVEHIHTPWPKNLWFDTSLYERLGDLEHAVETYGEDRILFGTNAPLLHPRANVDKLQCADLTAPQRDAIARGNAAALFPA